VSRNRKQKKHGDNIENQRGGGGGSSAAMEEIKNKKQTEEEGKEKGTSIPNTETN